MDVLTSITSPSMCDGVIPEATWADVAAGCEAEGKHIAIPRNATEILHMITLANATQCDDAWFGCTDIVGGSYHCADSSPVSSDLQLSEEFYESIEVDLDDDNDPEAETDDPTDENVGLCEYPLGTLIAAHCKVFKGKCV